MTRATKLTSVILLAAVLSGCAAGRAFRRGEQSSLRGDWDEAVVYLRDAVQKAPDRADYRIALDRAMLNASSVHVNLARDLEAKDQLDAALLEWKKVTEYDPANRQAAAKVNELDRKIRERIEAGRPRPPIEQLRQQARQTSAEPTLNPREPLGAVRFTNASVRDILNFIADSTGINVTYDPTYQDRSYSVQLDGVTLESALRQILSANNLFYKVLDQRTIIVVPETPQKRIQYDEQVIQTFYVSNADITELVQNLTNLTRLANLPIAPVIVPNRTANTITVRGTTTMVAIIEQIIRANDKPRAEVIIDVEILEINRERAKQYGLNLAAYGVEMFFSPEQPPAPAAGVGGGVNVTPFNLNTISQGVSLADFYLAVPSAIVRFLESDSTTKLLAKPQLRGAEGTRLTLNLGQDIPVLSTTYTPIATGGAGTNPLTSYNYRSIGLNVDLTPRVTYEGDVIIELTLESSALGPSINVAGTSVPSFPLRRVTTKLRLRDGESNLLAGLLREDERKSITGFPGIVNVPGLRALFGANDNAIQQSDIVMLLTPRVIRTHELTQEDVNPIFIGSQGNLGLTGPPPLIAPTGEPEPTVAPAPTSPATPPGPVVPPGSSPIPGTIVPPAQPPAQPAPPPQAAAPAAAQPQIPGAAEPARPTPAPAARVPAPPQPAQIVVTSPTPDVRVAGGPYTIPISVAGASRLSTISLTVSFNPQALRVRTIQEGSFMRQGGLNATFTQEVDASIGRINITIARASDSVGASGTGLLAVVLFDAIAPGSSTFTPNGVATSPEGTAVPLTFVPATVTVR
jgi:type II secretory pathway component GspD/PulD (secretin)